MSLLLSSPSPHSSVLQSLTVPRHVCLLNSLTGLRVALKKLQEARDEQGSERGNDKKTEKEEELGRELGSTLSSLSSVCCDGMSYDDSVKGWGKVLTKRQKDITSSSHGGKTIGGDFWSQVVDSAALSDVRSGRAFDDGKVYKDMLVAYMRSIQSSSSPLASSRGKGNGRKKVERKGSKGRKIRYNVRHAKIENFGIPKERGGGGAGWFKSMFGGRRR